MTLTAVRSPARTLPGLTRVLLPLTIGVIVFGVAFEGGAYGLPARNSIAIGVWWCVALAVGLSIWPLARIPRAAVLTAGLLLGLAAWTAASILWAESNEKAFNEFNRVALYAGGYLVAVVAGTRGNARRWSDGLALGLVAVALLALASRLFSGIFPDPDIAPFLPADQTRLNYPLNYWNALAFLIALAVPLLLRAAVDPAGHVRRALAVAPIPALAGTLYLTSSRGGTVAAVVGVVAFVALTSRRWAALGAVVVAVAGSAVVLASLLAREELVNGPLDSAAARAQGHSAAVVVALACAAAGLVYGLGARYLRAPTPKPHVGWALAGAVIGLTFVGLVAANPVQRFEEFKQVPVNPEEATTVGGHLSSTSGNGRWQWWNGAVDQFREEPLVGHGAGSFEAWWLQHGDLAGFVRDAHSLYLETLGELGVVGFLLLAGVFVTGIAAGAVRLRRVGVDERPTVAAFLAAFLAYALAAGIDWMWELTAVSLVGIVLLGLLTGPATAAAPGGESEPVSGKNPASRRLGGTIAAVLLVAAAPLLVGSQALALASTLKVRDSQTAVADRDAEGALSDALAATRLQPWAASTHLQVALVREERGELEEARAAIAEALSQDASDWRLWLVAARIETKLGRVRPAQRSLDRAIELNPRSPLFAGRG